MKHPRRQFLRFAAGTAVLSAFAPMVLSQTYPSRPVRVIVPAAAGGPSDIIGRLLAQKLSEARGKQFIVENIPTGAGNVGAGLAAKAPPDGYTILIPGSGVVVNPSLYAKCEASLRYHSRFRRRDTGSCIPSRAHRQSHCSG